MESYFVIDFKVEKLYVYCSQAKVCFFYEIKGENKEE